MDIIGSQRLQKKGVITGFSVSMHTFSRQGGNETKISLGFHFTNIGQTFLSAL